MYGTTRPTFSSEIPKTVSEAVDNAEARKKMSMAQKHGKTLLAAMSAALGSLTLGSTIGYTSPALPNLNSHRSAFHLSPVEISLVVGIISVGGIFGEPIGGYMLDRFGRKSTLLFTTVPFVFGWALVGSAPNVSCMYVGRFLTGLCSGMVDIAVPVYIAEISDKSVRGFMGSCHELSTNMGYLFVFSMGMFLPWNWLAISCCCLPVIMLFTMLLMPESPRWLLMRGRRDESVRALVWLRGPRADIGPELEAIEDNIRTSGSSMHWRELGEPALLKPLAIVAILMFCQQFSGYGAIPEYLVSIFESAGTSFNPYTQTAIVGAMGVLANLLSALVVDSVGRRVMLTISATVMFLSIGALAAFFTIKTFPPYGFDVVTIEWLPTLSMVSYNFGVALGYGPIPFYMASELFPLRARGMAGGISISLVWVFMLITSVAFPFLIEQLNEYVVYWILTFFTLFGVFVALFVVPETKGKSLEQIEKEFSKNK